MIKIRAKHIVLYAIGIALLLFGQRTFWEEILEERKEKQRAREMAEEADKASQKPFETQELQYDAITKTWKNNALYFQTIHLGKVNFKALKKPSSTRIETNDDENASSSN